MGPDEEKTLANIAEHGCHVLHVLAENDLPPFTYTVGIERASSAPEIVVIGLKQPICKAVFDIFKRRNFRPCVWLGAVTATWIVSFLAIRLIP
jgi:hypothetical protein